MRTRRTFCLLFTAFLSGCVSDPGASCRGATVRLSLSPSRSVDSPLIFDPERLSVEAVAVIETAIEDEHVERCVAWDPAAEETGASNGLSEIGDRIESHTGKRLDTAPGRLELDARFRGRGYTLVLAFGPSG